MNKETQKKLAEASEKIYSEDNEANRLLPLRLRAEYWLTMARHYAGVDNEGVRHLFDDAEMRANNYISQLEAAVQL